MLKFKCMLRCLYRD